MDCRPPFFNRIEGFLLIEKAKQKGSLSSTSRFLLEKIYTTVGIVIVSSAPPIFTNNSEKKLVYFSNRLLCQNQKHQNDTEYCCMRNGWQKYMGLGGSVWPYFLLLLQSHITCHHKSARQKLQKPLFSWNITATFLVSPPTTSQNLNLYRDANSEYSFSRRFQIEFST